MDDKRVPKISTPEIVLILLLVGTVDAFEFIATFIEPLPIIGQFITFAKFCSNFITLLGIEFWLIMKGEYSLWYVAGGSIETIGISFVNWLPIKTGTVVFTIIKMKAKEKLAEETGSLPGMGAARFIGRTVNTVANAPGSPSQLLATSPLVRLNPEARVALKEAESAKKAVQNVYNPTLGKVLNDQRAA